MLKETPKSNLPEENIPSSKFTVDEMGQILRPKKELEQSEINPVFELANLRDGLLIQSQHPRFVQKPADVLYWKTNRLENSKQILARMRTLAEQSGISEFTHPGSDKKIILKDFFDLIEKSIVYSEEINQRSIKEGAIQEPSPEQRATIRKKILGGNKAYI